MADLGRLANTASDHQCQQQLPQHYIDVANTVCCYVVCAGLALCHGHVGSCGLFQVVAVLAPAFGVLLPCTITHVTFSVACLVEPVGHLSIFSLLAAVLWVGRYCIHALVGFGDVWRAVPVA